MPKSPKIDEMPKESQPRLNLPLTADGKLDTASMRESTREKLRAALDGTTFQTPMSSGESGGVLPRVMSEFDPQLIGMLYDGLGMIEMILIQRAYGVTPEQAAIMRYSPTEKGMLTEPTRKVLDKYGAGWLSKFGEEIALAGLLVTIHIAKLGALQSLRKPQAETPVKSQEAAA